MEKKYRFVLLTSLSPLMFPTFALSEDGPTAKEIISKARIAQEIKSKRKESHDDRLMASASRGNYVQTEALLKVSLGSNYQEGDLDGNIRRFISKNLNQHMSLGKTPEIKKSTENLLISIIGYEKKQNRDFVFYHGLRGDLGFCYDVISFARGLLFINPLTQRKILRAFDDSFKDIYGVKDFLEKVSQTRSGSTPLDHQESFRKHAIAVNLSLFGNYFNRGESTISFFLNGNNISQTNGLKIIKDFYEFLEVDVDISRYENLYKKYFPSGEGRLLQIFVKPEEVDRIVYISEAYGDILKLPKSEKDLSSSPSALISSYRSDPLSFEETIKNNALHLKHLPSEHEKMGLSYSTFLQARIFLDPTIMHDADKVSIVSYASPLKGLTSETGPVEQWKNYQKDLAKLVESDLEAFLDAGVKIKKESFYGQTRKTVENDNDSHDTPSPLQHLYRYVKEGEIHTREKDVKNGSEDKENDYVNNTIKAKLIGKKEDEAIDIIKEKINISLSKEKKIIKEKDRSWTLADYAYKRENFKVVEFLLKEGATLSNEVLDNSSVVRTIRSIIKDKNLTNLIEALINNLEITQINKKYDEGKTVLHYAVEGENQRAAELILRKKADPNITDALDLTPIYYAIEKQSPSLVKLLIENQADLSDNGGLETPLEYAKTVGASPKIINILETGK